MQSTFDERNWLVWLVKVRILILTLLLAIELAVAQFTPSPLPMRLFLSTILFWYSISLFYVLLLSFWQEHIEKRNAVPEKNGTEEKPHWQRRWSELRHGQFDRQQESQDKNPNLYQPH